MFVKLHARVRNPLHHLLASIFSIISNQTRASFSSYSAQSSLFRFSDDSRFNKTNIDLVSLGSDTKSLLQAKQSHAFAIVNGLLPTSVSLAASLILSYGAYGEEAASRVLFEQSLLFCGNAFLWNTLMRALSIARIDDEFGTYNRMVRAGVRLDDHTFPFVLKACTDWVEVRKGMEIHGCVIKYGFDCDVFVGNTLLAFYGRCGDLSDAEKVFDEMPERDIVSWNTLIYVFSINGFNTEAIDLFREMVREADQPPSSVTFISVLPVCAKLEDELMATQIHSFVVKVGFDRSVKIGNVLIDTYGKCKNVKALKQLFEKMVERNRVSWNTIIRSLAYLHHSKDALDMFILMINSGAKPDSVTVSSILPVLVELELFDFGREVHGFSLRIGTESDCFIANSLIDMYAKAGRSTEASNVFKTMSETDVVSWNAMISNLSQNGEELAAIELLRAMQHHGEAPDSLTLTNVLPACARLGFIHPGKEIHARSIRMGDLYDLFVSNALMDMYAKCDCINLAKKVFDFSFKDEVSYNILIRGYSQTNDCAESLVLFEEMGIMGMKHDMMSFMGAISACANLSAIKQGKEIHGSSIRRRLHLHVFISNSLLDLYTKCGRIDLARRVFDQIPNKDVVSWNTMILGYGMLGELESAFNLFEAMSEDGHVAHDAVSYLVVLSACSHGGLVEKGRRYFKLMQNEGVKPTEMHYACIVDLLGRAGHMEEAKNLINSLDMETSSDILGALLGACRIHGNIELGHWAAEKLFELKPQHWGYYVLLSNLYAEAGQWDEAKRVREMMRSKGAKKNPGSSWVQVANQVFMARTADVYQPKSAFCEIPKINGIKLGLPNRLTCSRKISTKQMTKPRVKSDDLSVDQLLIDAQIGRKTKRLEIDKR